MTALFISLPGETGYTTYGEGKEGDVCFSFASFDKSREWRLPLAEQSIKNLTPYFSSEDKKPSSPNKGDYEALIAKTIAAIREKAWGKIVLSRPWVLDVKIDPLEVFLELVKAYPKACVYLFTHPEIGTWMGATPETLLQKNNGRLSTMSLAGTRRRGEEQTFTAKEKTEQQLVSDYIVQLFQNEKGLENVIASGPKISDAGNLVHFKTEISAEANRAFEPQPFLKKLHPTPAVGGFPREESLHFIRQYEKYDRSFYSGYFGLEAGGDFHYFVNLRCMQVFENSVVLYAGGGITADSDPTAEWEETEAKMQTLLNVIERS